MADQFVDANKMVPITPPPELVEQWRNLPEYISQLRTMSTVTITTEKLQSIATQAARWGADMELEACINYFHKYDTSWGEDSELIEGLRTARRPKPPSLAAEAIAVLDELDGLFELPAGHYNTILRALEKLDDSL